MTKVVSSTGLKAFVCEVITSLINRSRLLVLISCVLLPGAGYITAAPRSLASLKFEIKVVDSVTGKPRSKYLLGEPVSVVFTLTNQSRRARTIFVMEDTEIPYTLVSEFDDSKPETVEGWHGGTFGAYVRDGTTYWTQGQPRNMTLGPGQTVSVRIEDLRGIYSHRLRDGLHTLTATYLGHLKSKVSFRVVIDEAKSIPLLERMVAAPLPANGDEGDRFWAEDCLREIRQPSLSGLVTNTAGKPLKDVEISVTEENLEDETRSNGRYYFSQLKHGATYTLTPSLRSPENLRIEYTFEPASRTITNLNSKLTDLNFVATEVRPSVNFAEDFTGATATASSTLSAPDDKFNAEYVNDSVKAGPWDLCCNAAWTDGTPNKYPDWVEINFKRPRPIDWINVFTLQDHPEESNDPTLDEIFTRDGIIDFDVQYWNGRAWKNVPGGVIRGNRNVWRKIAFPTITTSKIRVVVRKALTPYSKIMEIEAFHTNVVPVVKLTGQASGPARSWFEFDTRASDKDGSIGKYTFSFGDGTPNYELEHGNNPAIKDINMTHRHMYMTPGTYTVTLRVTDHDFESSETSMTVTVTDPDKPPEATKKRKTHSIRNAILPK